MKNNRRACSSQASIASRSLVVSEVIAAVRFTPDPLPLSLVFALIALAASSLTAGYLRLLPHEATGACKVHRGCEPRDCKR